MLTVVEETGQDLWVRNTAFKGLRNTIKMTNHIDMQRKLTTQVFTMRKTEVKCIPKGT